MLSKRRTYGILICGLAILALSIPGWLLAFGHSVAEAKGQANSIVEDTEPVGPQKSIARFQVATPTLVGGYPSPPTETPAPPPEPAEGTREGYPIVSPEPTGQSPGAYPPATTVNPLGSTPESLFANTATAPADNADLISIQEQEEDGNSSERRSSSLLLWLGFMLALIIFVIGVVGSIILFARQRMTGS